VNIRQAPAVFSAVNSALQRLTRTRRNSMSDVSGQEPVPTFREIEVRPMSVHIGAEIGAVDLSRPLGDSVIAEIRKALMQWKVVFFHGQDLDHARHVAFSARFGELAYSQPYDPSPDREFPQVLTVKLQHPRPGSEVRRYGAEHLWHTDLTPAVNPPAACILRAMTVPPYGGDTLWTNLAAAYQGLSAPLRALADGLQAEHRFNARGLVRDARNPYFERTASHPFVAIHPVVRLHPHTGERVLFVNPVFTSHLLGVSPRESERLLEQFFEHLSNPVYTVRFRWQAGDVAFWDNQATAHLAPQDLAQADVERILFRTMIVGDIPVGVDGFRSQSVEGGLYGSEAPEGLRKYLAAQAVKAAAQAQG
jgi:taurine dioxygenase